MKKKIVILKDEYSSEVLRGLIVDEDVSLEKIDKEVLKVKQNLPGEWTIEEVINGLSMDIEEIDVEILNI